MRRLIQGIIIIILLGTLHQKADAQVTVKHLENISGDKGLPGVVYNLPMTVLKFDFTIRKTEEFRGPFATYAPGLLGIEDVIMDNDRYYEIVDAHYSAYIEPDPGQYYLVNLAEKSDRELILMQGVDGLSGKFAEEEEIQQVAANAGFMPGLPGNLFPKYIRTAKIEKTDTIKRVVTIDTTTIEKYILRRFMEEKTEEDKARDAADMINRLKEDKYKLLVGYQETAYDKGAMEFMYNKLESMERSYLTLFTGITREEVITHTVIFLPNTGNAGQSIPILPFSEDEGLLPSDPDEQLILEFDFSEEMEPGEMAPEGDVFSGIVYRVAPSIGFTLSYDGDALLEGRELINQFGSLRVLPDRVEEFSIDPATGNIQMVRIKPE